MILKVVRQVQESISSGHSGAGLISWATPTSLFPGMESRDPVAAIDVTVSAFRSVGWTWTGKQLEKAGWFAWFRSQGKLSPPIIQWGEVSQ